MTHFFELIDQIFVNTAAAIVALVTSLCERTGLPTGIATFVGMLLPVLVVITVFPALFAALTWVERKVLARIQNRYGPNRVGPWGLLQPVADGVKMMTKEDIVPRAADPLFHILAPILVLVPAIVVFSLLPFGNNMVAADVDVSLLLFFAISSFSTLALFLAGWGSHNKYSLIGAMRAIAQMVSYELPLVMAAVPAVMIAGSMQLSEIVKAQGGEGMFGSIAHWYVWTPWGFVGFLGFFIAGMAELNRSPFDLAEGESELVAGFHTEYSGMKFALFYMAEYLSAIAFSGLATSVYLGGYNGPAFLPSWLSFLGKMLLLLLLMMWIRGTLPRLRGDQLMAFSWKFLLPLALLNMVAAAAWFYVSGPSFGDKALAWVVALVIDVAAYLVLARVNSGPPVKKRVYRYANL